jgi:hypothetical protein
MKKNWYKSKTVMSAVVMAGLAVVQIFGIEVPQEFYVVIGSFGLYGVRDAMNK